MLPVGRLILLRRVPSIELVGAMIWFTVPAIFGSVAGPLVGGAIVTYASWPWVFWINLPLAAVAILLALIFIPESVHRPSVPFDFWGYMLLATALSGVLFGFVGTGRRPLPPAFSVAMILAGACCAYLYWRRARTITHPVVDFTLLRLPIFRSVTLGGLLVRTGLGATPFLLPLMLQLAFGLSAMYAGVLTFGWALGSLLTRPVISRALRALGFRSILIFATLMCSMMYVIYGQFTPNVPNALVFLILLVGGALRGLLMTSLNALGYSQVPASQMSSATVLASMCQQLSLTFGVAFAVLLLNLSLFFRSSDQLGDIDFALAFSVVGIVSALAIFPFYKLPEKAGIEMSQRGDTASR